MWRFAAGAAPAFSNPGTQSAALNCIHFRREDFSMSSKIERSGRLSK
jgi:hypothetical protein